MATTITITNSASAGDSKFPSIDKFLLDDGDNFHEKESEACSFDFVFNDQKEFLTLPVFLNVTSEQSASRASENKRKSVGGSDETDTTPLKTMRIEDEAIRDGGDFSSLACVEVEDAEAFRRRSCSPNQPPDLDVLDKLEHILRDLMSFGWSTMTTDVQADMIWFFESFFGKKYEDVHIDKINLNVVVQRAWRVWEKEQPDQLKDVLIILNTVATELVRDLTVIGSAWKSAVSRCTIYLSANELANIGTMLGIIKKHTGELKNIQHRKKNAVLLETLKTAMDTVQKNRERVKKSWFPLARTVCMFLINRVNAVSNAAGGVARFGEQFDIDDPNKKIVDTVAATKLTSPQALASMELKVFSRDEFGSRVTETLAFPFQCAKWLLDRVFLPMIPEEYFGSQVDLSTIRVVNTHPTDLVCEQTLQDIIKCAGVENGFFNLNPKSTELKVVCTMGDYGSICSRNMKAVQRAVSAANFLQQWALKQAVQNSRTKKWSKGIALSFGEAMNIQQAFVCAWIRTNCNWNHCLF